MELKNVAYSFTGEKEIQLLVEYFLSKLQLVSMSSKVFKRFSFSRRSIFKNLLLFGLLDVRD